jgi:uncharacterized protein (DUF58 family)
MTRRPQSKIQNPKSKIDVVMDSALLAKLDRLTLGVGRDLIRGLMGEHQAVRRTSGIEFADYRPYSAGDDLRRVDWNAYARLGTLQVRQAQAEHDTVLFLLLDASPSMDFGRPSKFFAARRLAASLGYIALAHLDRVVVATPGARDQGSEVRGQGSSGSSAPIQNPKSKIQNDLKSRAEAAMLFRMLQNLQPGQVAAFDDLLSSWSTQPGQGRVAVIISDLLLDAYRIGVRQLVGAGFQVNILHILSPEELRPADLGDLDLIDIESAERREIHLNTESLAAYHQGLDAWLEETEQWCRRQGAGYVRLESDWEIERVLLETLRRRGVTV